VYITNLKAYDKENVFTFSTALDLQPTIASDAPKPANYDFYLNLLSSESLVGRFRYKRKTYKVALRNCGFPIYNNRPEFEMLKFASAKEDSAFLKHWNTRPEYRVRDTVVLAKKVFLIKDASSLNSSVTLKPLHISARRVRPKQIDARIKTIASDTDRNAGAKPYPSFTIKGPAGTLSNETLKGKVVFVNFWFAACPPCIAEFEGLSEMYNRLKDNADFEFISFTFESPEVVQRVKEQYQLPFPIYSISEEECQRLSLQNAYPTNIIIDKKGLVKYVHTGGKVSKTEAKAFVDIEFYGRIVKEL
jgi:peroxiredoxin